jgi:hypothetical protein
MTRISFGYAAPLAFTILPLLTCCVSAQSSGDSGYKTVQASYDYVGDNKRTREWRAEMTALDKCHQSGFNNAEPAGPPQTTCMQGSANGCVNFHVTQVYNCFGMGN